MSKKYGPVMGVKFLNSYTVILSDIESVHQAFVKQGPTFAGRQQGGIFDVFSAGRGKWFCKIFLDTTSFKLDDGNY